MQKSFIEVQFPVSKISKESYKERKAGAGQTLTGLGKWWGRKPLILVRATILGLLFPASENPKKDMEIFLKILSMDTGGLLKRKYKTISTKEVFKLLTKEERAKYFLEDSTEKNPKYKARLATTIKDDLQKMVFLRMTYDEKLTYCVRPEHVKLDEEWEEINEYLKTEASNLEELIQELGIRMFKRVPLLGDCFCGGGSIPFEGLRMGCHTIASDLNPIASALTYGALNVLSESNDNIAKIKQFQNQVFDEVMKEIDKLRLETSKDGKRSHFYLYCMETICPECGTKIPLSTNWVVSKHKKIVADLQYNSELQSYDIKIINNATAEQIKIAQEKVTIVRNAMNCIRCNKQTSIQALRKDRRDENNQSIYGLRRWIKKDFIPRETDIFQERLYCVKYFEKHKDKTWEETIKRPAAATDASYGVVEYREPMQEDYDAEMRINKFLQEKFEEWDEKQIIPIKLIETGYNTEQVIRERGWQYWHQLFNPRQLLVNGLFVEKVLQLASNEQELIIGLLGVNKIVDRNSKLCIWHIMDKQEKGENTFYNQALNTLYNYTTRSLSTLFPTWYLNLNNVEIQSNSIVRVQDARQIDNTCDLWITDPPYADAVNYHELSEFFLGWDRAIIKKAFEDWYTDTKRVLAVQGVGSGFNQSMIEIYKVLTRNMTDDGFQVVMFTHQDVKVWAELALILWSAGLKVTAAWNISTETQSGGLKDGNYVTGTVNLILRKQLGDDTAYLDELYMDIEDEVKAQIDSMNKLDEGEEPNFSDGDYLLAAYAASLKVLTSYKNIEDIDLEYELKLARENPDKSEVVRIINEARKIAYDYLIPTGFDSYHWKSLSSEERFYIKGLELQKNGCYQLGLYHELARGYGVVEYTDILASTRANQVRLKTPNEYEMKNIGNSSKFGNSLVRIILAAIYIAEKEESPNKGLGYIKKEVTNYWSNRELIIEVLNYMNETEAINGMETTWGILCKSIGMLKTVVENDSI